MAKRSRMTTPPRYEPTKIKSAGRDLELCLLNMGTDQKPHVYTRLKLTMKEIIAGRRATLPWRRVG